MSVVSSVVIPAFEVLFAELAHFFHRVTPDRLSEDVLRDMRSELNRMLVGKRKWMPAKILASQYVRRLLESNGQTLVDIRPGLVALAISHPSRDSVSIRLVGNEIRNPAEFYFA